MAEAGVIEHPGAPPTGYNRRGHVPQASDATFVDLGTPTSPPLTSAGGGSPTGRSNANAASAAHARAESTASAGRQQSQPSAFEHAVADAPRGHERQQSQALSVQSPRSPAPTGLPPRTPGRTAPPAGQAQTYEAQTQANLSKRFAMVRGGLDKFPLIACFWCPLVLLINGVAYLYAWRVAFTTSRAYVDGASTPVVLHVLSGWLLGGLFITHGLTVPAFLDCAMSQQIDRLSVRRKTLLVSVAHALVVCLPIALCEGFLLFRDNDRYFHLSLNRNIEQPWVAGLSFGLSVVTPIVMVWWMYLEYVVDILRRKSAEKANEFVRKNYGDGRRYIIRKRGTSPVPPLARASPEVRAQAALEEVELRNRINDAASQASTPPPSVQDGEGMTPSGRPLLSGTN